MTCLFFPQRDRSGRVRPRICLLRLPNRCLPRGFNIFLHDCPTMDLACSNASIGYQRHSSVLQVASMLCDQSSDQPFPAAHCHFVLAPVRRQRANHESVHLKHYMLSHMSGCLESKQSPKGTDALSTRMICRRALSHNALAHSTRLHR